MAKKIQKFLQGAIPKDYLDKKQKYLFEQYNEVLLENVNFHNSHINDTIFNYPHWCAWPDPDCSTNSLYSVECARELKGTVWSWS